MPVNGTNMELRDYQKDAVSRMHNGCILCGGVGSGKSITAIAYYFFKNGGDIGHNKYVKMSGTPPDLYIITTAKKRDDFEWDRELIPFCLSTNQMLYSNKVVIDSWNNIAKYKDVENAFFIFDEQRVVGDGKWSKTFINIARHNEWILLSATPGDKWEDYMSVFIANGFYKNKTEFSRKHLVYKNCGTFSKVDPDRYLNVGRLTRLRNNVVVQMKYCNDIERRHTTIYTDYDTMLYRSAFRNRWNPYTNEPIKNASELCQTLRRIVNSDISRLEEVYRIVRFSKRVIIFYCYDYELELLRNYDFGDGVEKAEWNGHKHQPIPDSEKWIYLVNYTAGSEGWNCIRTDTIIFYSQNYSYRMMVQAAGRIDRLNTPYPVLYYYHLKSHASIDLAISKALSRKKKFNESMFINW